MRQVGFLMFAAVGALAWVLDGSGRSFGQQEAKQAVAQPAAQPKAAAAAEDAMVQQIEQQYGKYIRQMYKTELEFMKLVAEPTKQQFDKISADAEPVIKTASRKIALSMRGPGEQDFDPHAAVAEAIAKSLKSTLPPDKIALFDKELALRTAAQKRMVVKNLVSMIDHVLLLRPEQREKIGEVLAANWDESWNQTQLFMYGGQYFPAMPDAKIAPLLTEPQRAVWRGIAKGNVRFGINWGWNNMVIEEAAVEVAPDAP